MRLFSEPAIRRISRYSRGIPRVINTLCDHCLVFGYADKVRCIDEDIVDEVIKYLEDDGEPRSCSESRNWRTPWPKRLRRWSPVRMSTPAVAGPVGVATTMLREAIDLCASSLAGLARSALGLLRP